MASAKSLKRRSTISSYAAGLLFGAGWWLLIDAIIYYHNVGKVEKKDPSESITWVTFIPGVIGTIGFILVCLLSKKSLSSEDEENNLGSIKSLYIIFAFSVTFAGIISGFWILFDKYSGESYSKYGIFMLMQSLCIFISTYIFRFGRPTGTSASF